MGSITRAGIPFDIKKIAIIGAGPSGLAVAKYLVAEAAFHTVDIFEQQSEVGGIWNYTPSRAESVPVPQTTPHVPPDTPFWPKDAAAPVFSNPMYERLNTNISKNLMQYSDQDFPSEALLFPPRQDVQNYLIQYSRDIRHLILFSSQVEDISLSYENSQAVWNLRTRSTITDEKSVRVYDAVVVSNGHYSVPFIPSVPGMAEFHTAYPSLISHSKIFRTPDGFANKKVIVVGNSASGLDIGSQIVSVSKKPLLNSVHHPSPIKWGQENKEEVPAIAEYLIEERAVRFEDGRIEKDIDAIVYCTGYLYSYPFLESLEPPIVTTGRRGLGLWQHLFSMAFPTLAFIMMPQKIIPFPLAESQGAAIAKVWSNKLKLPKIEEMENWEENRVTESGNGTSFHVLSYPQDAKYLNYIHDWVMTAEPRSGKEPPYWNEEKCWVREIYSEVRKKFVEEGSNAKSMSDLGFDFQKRSGTKIGTT